MSLASKTLEVMEIENDQGLMDQVLDVYFDNTRYLKSAIIQKIGDPENGGHIRGLCKFDIPESCYIKSTGHFNSVEFNICYNQMMYYVVAKCVKDGLMNALHDWDLNKYFKKQLPDVLIVNFKSTFRSAMRAGHFYGEIVFSKTKNIPRKSMILL